VPGHAGAVPGRVRAAYDGDGWVGGPELVYDRLAELLVATAAGPLAGLRALDVGTGTGAAARALHRRGALVVATDLLLGMLRVRAADRPPCAVGDVLALPVRTGAVDLAVAAFVVNHLDLPARAFRELRRVTRPGGAVLASSWGGTAQVKQVVDSVLRRYGYVMPDWYLALQAGPAAGTSQPEQLAEAMAAGGLAGPAADLVDVDLTGLGAPALAAWRLGMPAYRPFVLDLPPATRGALVEEVTAAVAGCVPASVPVVLARATVPPG
jgi:SAM-dependent methyltransferase